MRKLGRRIRRNERHRRLAACGTGLRNPDPAPRSATADISYLDDLYHAEADKLGITYVDIWDGFVDEDGRYAVQGPDFEGQIRRLRTGDGVHFTKFGALKLAHLVDQELSRIIANPSAPVLPSPQAAAPAKPGTARPAVGPVLPLTAAGGGGQMISGGEAGSLLGAGGNPGRSRRRTRPSRVRSFAAIRWRRRRAAPITRLAAGQHRRERIAASRAGRALSVRRGIGPICAGPYWVLLQRLDPIEYSSTAGAVRIQMARATAAPGLFRI